MWRKPGCSVPNGNCAEATSGGGAVLVRDATDQDGIHARGPCDGVAAFHAPAGSPLTRHPAQPGTSAQPAAGQAWRDRGAPVPPQHGACPRMCRGRAWREPGARRWAVRSGSPFALTGRSFRPGRRVRGRDARRGRLSARAPGASPAAATVLCGRNTAFRGGSFLAVPGVEQLQRADQPVPAGEQPVPGLARDVRHLLPGEVVGRLKASQPGFQHLPADLPSRWTGR